jgi:acyl carrier protein
MSRDRSDEQWRSSCIATQRSCVSQLRMLLYSVAYVGNTVRAQLVAHRISRSPLSGAYARVEVSSVSTIAVEVVAQIATALHIEASCVTRGASLTGDLGADSLDSVALVMAIEDHFSIDLPDEEMLELGTVGQVIEYVELAVAMRQPAPA